MFSEKCYKLMRLFLNDQTFFCFFTRKNLLLLFILLKIGLLLFYYFTILTKRTNKSSFKQICRLKLECSRF